MNATRKEEQGQDDVELLLPWHAAGTLNRRDAARVEQALANDNELARRYELVREELGEAIRVNESLGAPSARSMNKLFEMIEAEPVRAPKASLNLAARLAGFLSSLQPRTLAYAGSAAAIVVMLQAGILAGMFLNERQAGPQLASYEQTDPAGQGSFVLVRFNPQASAADIAAFLQENKATIVGGPAAGTGLFRLRVSEAKLPQEELAATVRRIGQHAVIGFSVPTSQP